MRKTRLQIMKEARDLIKDRRHWTTRAKARNRRGGIVDVFDASAVQFCALGALLRTSGGEMYYDSIPSTLMGLIRKNIGSHSLTGYNDSHSHRSVVMLFNRVIRALEAKKNLR